jgi:hypothetical protein
MGEREREREREGERERERERDQLEIESICVTRRHSKIWFFGLGWAHYMTEFV